MCSDSVLVFNIICKVNLFSDFFLNITLSNIYTQKYITYFAKLISGLTKFMGRNCYGPKLSWAEIDMGRFCYGPK